MPKSRQAVEAVLAEVPEGLDDLQLGDYLRRKLPPNLARAAAQLHVLRRRAASRLADAGRLDLTRRGLEQATHQALAAWRADRIAERSPSRIVVDLTAGVASDSRACQARGLAVLALDRDPLVAACAAANLSLTAGPAPAGLVRADAARPPLPLSADRQLDAVALVDPDRRAGGGRALDPTLWSPTLAEALTLAGRFAGACLKLAPAFDPERDPTRWGSDQLPSEHAWRWVSLAGELHELSLWTGLLTPPGPRRGAVLLHPEAPPREVQGEPIEVDPLDSEAAAAARFVWEPDPAVIRSGLVGLEARRTASAPLGPALAFLGAADRPPAPSGKSWRVLGSSPLKPRAVRALLAEHDVGALDLKKRGHPESSGTLAKRFAGPGSRRGMALVARLERGQRFYLVERLEEGEE